MNEWTLEIVCTGNQTRWLSFYKSIKFYPESFSPKSQMPKGIYPIIVS